MRVLSILMIATAVLAAAAAAAPVSTTTTDALVQSEPIETTTNNQPTTGKPANTVQTYIVVLHSHDHLPEVERSLRARIAARNSNADSKRNALLTTYSLIPGFVATLDPVLFEEVRRDPRVKYIERDSVVSIQDE